MVCAERITAITIEVFSVKVAVMDAKSAGVLTAAYVV